MQSTMSLCLVVVFLLSSFQLVRIASHRLTMRPDHLRTSTNRQTVNFTCTTDSELTGCQFRWWNWKRYPSPLLELSLGSLPKADSNAEYGLPFYRYSGRGLGAGDCGVSLRVKSFSRWLVSCRVRAETGGWTYAWSDLTAETKENLPHTRTPKEYVVLPGGEAKLTLKAREPLSQCRFYSPDLSPLDFDEGAQSNHSTGRHRYLGGGLKGGDCGFALSNVSEVDNGPVLSYIRNTADTKQDYRFMALIVARPPGAPTLSVNYTDTSVTATCEVQGARPVASISWVLGDDIVREDSRDDRPGSAQDEWRWPWSEASVLQRLTLTLQAEDTGQVLKCVVSHLTLERPLEATEIISFPEPASETTPPVTISTTARTIVYISTTPPVTTSTTARTTVHTSTTATSPCSCHSTSLGPPTDPACTATSMLGLLCREYTGRASQLANTSCPKDEVHEFRVREAGAAARTAELVEEKAKIALEAAKAKQVSTAVLAKMAEEQAMFTLEETKSSARAKEARARREEAWATNAEEELQFKREERSETMDL